MINEVEMKSSAKNRISKFGRREKIRTSDPLVPNQLRYSPKTVCVLLRHDKVVNNFLINIYYLDDKNSNNLFFNKK
ncbi:hypothetical protein ARAF_1448 [Arsenophonus endosymbiont of Aleurodicus floccissimus]|nr:hypothetical protein ARAF_1448 [Arsenophonus endosymbiont of Aleurodicus floccissimus]